MNNGLGSLQNSSIAYNLDKKKSRNKKILLFLLILMIIGAIAGLVAFLIMNKEKEKILYIGEWDCENGIFMKVYEDHNFSMGNPQFEATGTYQLKSEEEKDGIKKFLISFDAKKRIIDGKTIDSPYTTEYEFNIKLDDTNVMSMINTSTYSIYNCTKK